MPSHPGSFIHPFLENRFCTTSQTQPSVILKLLPILSHSHLWSRLHYKPFSIVFSKGVSVRMLSRKRGTSGKGSWISFPPSLTPSHRTKATPIEDSCNTKEMDPNQTLENLPVTDWACIWFVPSPGFLMWLDKESDMDSIGHLECTAFMSLTGDKQ